MSNIEEKDIDLADFSIIRWITDNGIVNEKGEPLDFLDHPFLLDILTDWNPRIVVKACSQVGKSVTFTIKTLFAVKNLRLNVIYTMPTDDDVREFVATKTNKIIQANYEIFKGMDTDSIERKSLNGRNIFFKGTISKSAAISTTADLLIHDEASRSDQKQLDTYRSRTKDSEYKGRWIFSNPTTERDILDTEWGKSDQKEWCVTCPYCEVEHHLVWPDSIDITSKQYQCRFCKKPISDDVRRSGRWIAQGDPNSKVSGYHLSHLIATKITAAEIIEDSEGDQEYFFNFVLGEPYNPGDIRMGRETILDLWTSKDLRTGNYFLGVDVGNMKHYVIRSELGLVKCGRFTNWSELDDIIKSWKPKAMVIDAMPDNTAAKHYVKTYRFAKMSFFQENANNPQTIVWWGEGDRAGIVYSHRDRILDRMFTDMLEAKYLVGMRADKDFAEYIKHYETLRRVKVINNKGIERYVWESTTNVDHYVFADLYSYLALLGNGNAEFIAPTPKTEGGLIRNDNTVGDFKKLLNDQLLYGTQG
jgi:hypothetical protein